MTDQAAIPLIFLPENGVEAGPLDDGQRAWAKANGFAGQRGRLLAMPDAKGAIAAWLFGTGPEQGRPVFVAGLASASLPEGDYQLQGGFGDPTLAAIAFRLGAYRFESYRSAPPAPRLVLPEAADAGEVERQVAAASLTRDLINTPANDLGPDALEARARELATRHDMSVAVIKGDDLLEQNFPMIHAVGRASAQAPRLIDLRWGKETDPKVTPKFCVYII